MDTALNMLEAASSSASTDNSGRINTPDGTSSKALDDCPCESEDLSQKMEEAAAAELFDAIAEELGIDETVEKKSKKPKKSKKKAADDGAEEEDEDSADELSDASYDSYDDTITAQRAKNLNTQTLYNAYVDRLKKVHPPSDAHKAPRLVKGFIDYVQHLEARIDMLESKAGVEKPDKDDGDSKDDDEAAEDGESTEQKTEDGEPPEPEATLETKFYFIEDHLDETGTLRGDQISTKGTFRSNVDPKHLLRVVYGFEGDHARKPAVRLSDELPSDAKIWCVRINSEPISTFFKSLVNVELHKDNIIEMFAPFRILLRNLNTIRRHYNALEKKFGLVLTSFDAMDATDKLTVSP